ncbi:MAG: PDZ domain-containing protein [Planctomycetes bacterium]|nr:PDZ domain-containing protein [Planctomycetota bacterium]
MRDALRRQTLAATVLFGSVGLATAAPPPGVQDFRQIVEEATDRVFPAVIYIRCVRETHESGTRISKDVTGSGVMISAEGFALTNWHVIEKAVSIRCQLADGRHFKAEAVGSDKDLDVGVIRLLLEDDAEPIPVARLGDSAAMGEGDFVMAMGAPWGLNRSVSIGIISCRRRYLPDASEYSLWLQTDAAINPGNSGGPLVDTRGEVIGLNTRGVSMGDNVGFTIPINVVKLVLPRLMQGEVGWSWTGLNLQPINDFNRDIYFGGEEGVIVASIEPESPAERAGLRARDRILAIGDQRVAAMTEDDLPQIRRHLGLLPRDTDVPVRVTRGGKELTCRLTPQAKGRVEGEELDCPRWDVTLKAINQFENEDLHFHRKEGVFVYGIRTPGNSLAAGLQREDIILSIDGTRINTLDDARLVHEASIEKVDERHKLLLTVLRGGLTHRLVIDFARDYSKE